MSTLPIVDSPLGIPASGCVTLGFLRVDQHVRIADSTFQSSPPIVVQHLRGVIPIVNIRLAAVWQIIADQDAGADPQARMILGPAEILPTEQTFGGHRRRRRVTGLIRIDAPVESDATSSRKCPALS